MLNGENEPNPAQRKLPGRADGIPDPVGAACIKADRLLKAV
jgi:hypothetical protein